MTTLIPTPRPVVSSDPWPPVARPAAAYPVQSGQGVAAGKGHIRTFWQIGGCATFRDEAGRSRFIHVATLRAVRNELRRMARDARGAPRDRLCVMWAQADETLNDVTNWRLAASGAALERHYRGKK